MKTLIEMKKVYCFNRFVLFVMVLSLATTFTSCSNDDDEDIPVYSLKDVEGNYLGKMTTESAPVIPTKNAGESEEPVGIEVNAEVKDNEIAINKFPVDDLIKSIIEDPDQAEIIIIKAINIPLTTLLPFFSSLLSISLIYFFFLSSFSIFLVPFSTFKLYYTYAFAFFQPFFYI